MHASSHDSGTLAQHWLCELEMFCELNIINNMTREMFCELQLESIWTHARTALAGSARTALAWIILEYARTHRIIPR